MTSLPASSLAVLWVLNVTPIGEADLKVRGGGRGRGRLVPVRPRNPLDVKSCPLTWRLLPTGYSSQCLFLHYVHLALGGGDEFVPYACPPGPWSKRADSNMNQDLKKDRLKPHTECRPFCLFYREFAGVLTGGPTLPGIRRQPSTRSIGMWLPCPVHSAA